MDIQTAIKKVIEKIDLSQSESSEVFEQIMSGSATNAQISAFIVALRMKGETVDEIIGATKVLRDKVTNVIPQNSKYLVDTCGTGGDGAQTFNVSTATAFVVAGAGASVAKHGNRSVSSKCGSADVLEALGVNVSVNENVMKSCLDEIGICFLFAPSLHKAMKHAIVPRKEIAIRTIFNILGPLTNPSKAKNQLLGVFDSNLTEPLANVLKGLGSNRAFVVHGLEKLDEISISGPTQISELNNNEVRSYTISPNDFNLSTAPISDIAGGDAKFNADVITKIFSGEKSAKRDIVILNAGFAITASGIVNNVSDGIKKAIESIDSGASMEKLRLLAEKTSN